MSDIDEITERMKRFPQIIQKMLSLQVKAAGILTVLVAAVFGKHAGVSALIGSVSVYSVYFSPQKLLTKRL